MQVFPLSQRRSIYRPGLSTAFDILAPIVKEIAERQDLLKDPEVLKAEIDKFVVLLEKANKDLEKMHAGDYGKPQEKPTEVTPNVPDNKTILSNALTAAEVRSVLLSFQW